MSLTGGANGGSPADEVRIINAFQRRLYEPYDRGENFRGVVYPGVGHGYTREMWRETVAWLDSHL